jgi:hypothetical protein
MSERSYGIEVCIGHRAYGVSCPRLQGSAQAVQVLRGKPSSELRVDGDKKGLDVLLNWDERRMKMKARVTKKACQTKVLCEDMGGEARQERVDGDYLYLSCRTTYSRD